MFGCTDAAAGSLDRELYSFTVNFSVPYQGRGRALVFFAWDGRPSLPCCCRERPLAAKRRQVRLGTAPWRPTAHPVPCSPLLITTVV
jgi:hypothetical protein